MGGTETDIKADAMSTKQFSYVSPSVTSTELALGL
jgi:hypothetical protein